MHDRRTLATATKQLLDGPSAREFPITAMTRALRIRLGTLKPRAGGRAALDVGTGTGIHAYDLLNAGYRVVHAIDRCDVAVKRALGRLTNLGFAGARIVESLVDPNAEHRTGICFESVNMMRLPRHASHCYDVMCMNPPAFYASQPLDIGDPVQSGVYAGQFAAASERDKSHLWRFFDSVVRKFLALDGHVICTWPGMERRVVGEQVGIPDPGVPQHPVELLREWFGFEIESSVPLNWESFFSEKVLLEGDYGLASFWDDLALADEKHCLSRYLFRGQDAEEADRPTFQFGVLHLERTGENEFIYHP